MVHVFHVCLVNVVVKGTEGVGVLGSIVSHAHQTRVDVLIVRKDINWFQGHVFHVGLMNVVVKGTVGVGVLGNIVMDVIQQGVNVINVEWDTRWEHLVHVYHAHLMNVVLITQQHNL